MTLLRIIFAPYFEVFHGEIWPGARPSQLSNNSTSFRLSRITGTRRKTQRSCRSVLSLACGHKKSPSFRSRKFAKLNSQGSDFKLLEVMALPVAYTKGADAMNRSKTVYQRKAVSFQLEMFNKIVQQIEKLAKSGATVNPDDSYPPLRRHKGKSRDLPMVDSELRNALTNYLQLRITNGEVLKPSSPLFMSQKGTPYSPNTLQEQLLT